MSRTICLLDTSIFVEILEVPGKSQRHQEIMDLLKEKIATSVSLFLPMATILETGNHIGQISDGQTRRTCAIRFVDSVSKALEGLSPFKPIRFLDPDSMKKWLAEFPDHALRGCGLGDLSIIHDWEQLCRKDKQSRVYIWTLDTHMAGYDRVGDNINGSER